MSQSLELATLKVEEEDLLKLRCLITENLNKLKVEELELMSLKQLGMTEKSFEPCATDHNNSFSDLVNNAPLNLKPTYTYNIIENDEEDEDDDGN